MPDKKPQYEKPGLIDLNELPIQAGGWCTYGTHVSTTPCASGVYPRRACGAGTGPNTVHPCEKGDGAQGCNVGASATVGCQAGVNGR